MSVAPDNLKVKAVLFDLGNTLVYQQPYEPFRRILQANGIIKSVEEIKKAFEKGNKDFDAERQIVFPPHEFYVLWNMTILKNLGITSSARKLAAEIDRQWFKFSKIYVYPDAKESLRKLKHMGLKLGVVTGGYEIDIKHMLSPVGLEGFFDVCVGADTTGKRKPDPEAFKHALKRLGVKAEEAIFVGDRLEQDYLGAQKVGMNALLIQREDKPVSGVKKIASLEEIFNFL
jgi:putative hydrolase of the HAD superfamily